MGKVAMGHKLPDFEVIMDVLEKEKIRVMNEKNPYFNISFKFWTGQ